MRDWKSYAFCTPQLRDHGGNESGSGGAERQRKDESAATITRRVGTQPAERFAEPNGCALSILIKRRELDPDVTLRRALAPEGDSVVYQDRMIHVASWAAKFLFAGEQLNQPVGKLSGGERARVLIAQLMLQPADVLLLDEPTNDLDIPTLDILEESLLEFRGSLVLVTHDRYMLDRVSTVVLGLDGERERRTLRRLLAVGSMGGRAEASSAKQCALCGGRRSSFGDCSAVLGEKEAVVSGSRESMKRLSSALPMLRKYCKPNVHSLRIPQLSAMVRA